MRSFIILSPSEKVTETVQTKSFCIFHAFEEGVPLASRIARMLMLQSFHTFYIFSPGQKFRLLWTFYGETTKGPELSPKTRPQSSSTRWCFISPQNSSLVAHPSTYQVQVVDTLSFLFLIQPCLSVWPSSCLLSVKTAPLLLWLQNSVHFTHEDQNIWTLLIFLCRSFCLEFSASGN